MMTRARRDRQVHKAVKHHLWRREPGGERDSEQAARVNDSQNPAVR